MATATKLRARKPAATNGKPADHAAQTASRTRSPKPGSPPPADTELLAPRAALGLRLGSAAQRKAARIKADPARNRSTQTRAALRVKADALDEVVAVLAGKDATAQN
ncbi:MAG: hypothetical protein ABSB73_09180 [Solirubrobacteraceae bacterium]